jgi:hypothetical protein
MTRKCSYCDQPEHTERNISRVGQCTLHARMWDEDVKSGFKQNRLKDILEGRRNPDGTMKSKI